jgi:hypothetical protein
MVRQQRPITQRHAILQNKVSRWVECGCCHQRPTLHARSAHVLRLSTIRAAARSILNDVVVKGTHGHCGHGRQQRPTATSTTTARESKAQPEDGFSFGVNPFHALTGLGGMVPPHPRLSLPKRPPTQALRFHAATSTGPCGMHPSRDVVPAVAVCHSIDTRSRCAHDGQPTHHQRSLQKDVRGSYYPKSFFFDKK